MTDRIPSIFLSYAERDADYVIDVKKVLQRLSNAGICDYFDYKDQKAGADWQQLVRCALDRSRASLVFLSYNYFCSDVVRDIEIPRLKDKAKEMTYYIIPIIVRPVYLPDEDFFSRFNRPAFTDTSLCEMDLVTRDRFLANLDAAIREIMTPFNEHSHSKVGQHVGFSISRVEGKAEMARYNIVVMGRTGVGKSSLINYLFGRHVFETGTGNVVTKRGFHRLDIDLNGIPATLYDSWGLEVGKDEQWLSDLKMELAQRGVDKPVERWFHTVFYLIQAPGHRIEDFEKEIMRQFIIEKYRVVVVFTKAELVSDECITQLHGILRHEVAANLHAVAVCSVRETTRLGQTQPFGVDRLIVEIFQGFWESIINRVPGRCISIMNEKSGAVFDGLVEYIQQNTGYFNHKAIASEVHLRCEKMRVEAFGNG